MDRRFLVPRGTNNPAYRDRRIMDFSKDRVNATCYRQTSTARPTMNLNAAEHNYLARYGTRVAMEQFP
jgi:hypothetical protein